MANSGVQAANSQSWTNTNPPGSLLPINNYLILPPITIPNNATHASIEFYIWTMLMSWPIETFSLVVSTSTPQVENFVAIHTQIFTDIDTNPRLQQHDLIRFAGQTIYIAFRHHSTQDMFGIVLDDVKVTVVDATSDFDRDIVPAVTALRGNFPNPFNPETTIKFGVRNVEVGSEFVNIEIFNVRGQKVKTLVNEYFSAGEHSVVWDGRDDAGRTVGSGVYLYRMTAGEFSETRRMVLMK